MAFCEQGVVTPTAVTGEKQTNKQTNARRKKRRLQIATRCVFHPLVRQCAIPQFVLKLLLLVDGHVEPITNFADAAIQARFLTGVVRNGLLAKVRDAPATAEVKTLVFDVI